MCLENVDDQTIFHLLLRETVSLIYVALVILNSGAKLLA